MCIRLSQQELIRPFYVKIKAKLGEMFSLF